MAWKKRDQFSILVAMTHGSGRFMLMGRYISQRTVGLDFFLDSLAGYCLPFINQT